MAKKGEVKLNKLHNGKEFSNSFRFVGLVKPVRKKEEDSDNWYDVPIYQVTKTQTNKDRRVLQFIVETAERNELKVELAGMEMEKANVYSSTHKKNHKIDWADRFNKDKYPDDTYHLIETDWDKVERLGKQIKAGMWVDVRGSYEFDTFTSDNGQEIKTVKRIIQQVFPLKNGEVEIKGLKEGDEFRVYDSAEDGILLGYGKANKEGIAKIKVGWLNPNGGKLYICKVENGNEGKRVEQEYNNSVTENDRIIVRNNIDSEIRIPKADGKGYEFITYVRDFKSENFVEINTFEMQIGIKSTYQDEETKDTKVNAVYLTYGKERSIPKDVELTVYYKEKEDGTTPLADAFARLNRLDFLVVEGVDNNRAEFALVEVEEAEEDNPFDNVGDKVTSYERVTTGTKKGLEITKYVGGTYQKQFLTEEEIELQQNNDDDPFGNIEINDDDLPF